VFIFWVIHPREIADALLKPRREVLEVPTYILSAVMCYMSDNFFLGDRRVLKYFNRILYIISYRFLNEQNLIFFFG